MGITQLPRAPCPYIPGDCILGDVQRQTEPCGHGEEEEEEEAEAAAHKPDGWF